MPLLLFERVSKWYGPVIGVNQVTLELRSGITGLVGANGAGKSTLMRLATGQLAARPRPRPRARPRRLERRRPSGTSATAPTSTLFTRRCPAGSSSRRWPGCAAIRPAEARRRTEAVLELVGMDSRADRRLRGYSKGMRQRIKLAQALVHDPELLILDEPLSGIDPIGRQESLALFRELARRGKCLLVSSHELEELEKLTDHVAIMARGRIAAVGTVPADPRPARRSSAVRPRSSATGSRELAAGAAELCRTWSASIWRRRRAGAFGPEIRGSSSAISPAWCWKRASRSNTWKRWTIRRRPCSATCWAAAADDRRVAEIDRFGFADVRPNSGEFGTVASDR